MLQPLSLSLESYGLATGGLSCNRLQLTHIYQSEYITLYVPGSSTGRLGRSLAARGMPWLAGNSSQPA